jgi:hypothetical protein
MRARFGQEVLLEATPPDAPFPRTFRVLDSEGHPVLGFSVFKTGIGIEEWAWEEVPSET